MHEARLLRLFHMTKGDWRKFYYVPSSDSDPFTVVVVISICVFQLLGWITCFTSDCVFTTLTNGGLNLYLFLLMIIIMLNLTVKFWVKFQFVLRA